MRSTSFSITSRTRTIATTVILKLVLRTAFKITDPLRPKKSFQCDYYIILVIVQTYHTQIILCDQKPGGTLSPKSRPIHTYLSVLQAG